MEKTEIPAFCEKKQHFQHVGAQDGLGQLVPDIPSRLQQLGHDVPQGGYPHADEPGGLFFAAGFDPLRQIGDALGLPARRA